MKKMNPAIRVSVLTLIINAVLTVFKLAAGVLSGSSAMVSDAVHSASDVFSTVIVMVGVAASRKKSDREHPYGHDRMENVASILLSVMLLVTGVMIGWRAVSGIVSGEGTKSAPGISALVAAIVSIAVKEWMFHYTKAVAVREKYSSLLADAWHHRSDALSSVGSLLGVGMARLGFPVFDPLAGLVICVFIVKAAVDIFREACDGLLDRAASCEIEDAIRDAACDVTGVLGVDSLTTRRFGSGYYVDIEIAAPGDMPLHEAHDIAEAVHDRIESAFSDIKHCMVHVNPRDGDTDKTE